MERPDTDETSRLLSELDSAIDHSCLLRDIVNYRKQLQDLERLTGPCRKTRRLRARIKLLERRLNLTHGKRTVVSRRHPAEV